MDWFDRLREKLFGPAGRPGAGLHHGPLQRSEAFIMRYTTWVEGNNAKTMMREMEQLWRQARAGEAGPLVLLDNPQAGGFRLERPAQASAEDLSHLLDLFRDRLLDHGYRLHMSDERIGSDGVQRERHYLKPVVDAIDMPLDQRFGNITLETWGPHPEARHLQVLRTTYSDRNYRDPWPVEELVELLLAR